MHFLKAFFKALHTSLPSILIDCTLQHTAEKLITKTLHCTVRNNVCFHFFMATSYRKYFKSTSSSSYCQFYFTGILLSFCGKTKHYKLRYEFHVMKRFHPILDQHGPKSSPPYNFSCRHIIIKFQLNFKCTIKKTLNA